MIRWIAIKYLLGNWFIMYKKYTAVISLALVALAMLGATIGSGLNTAYGNGELGKGSPNKEEFQITVRNIKHKDLLVSVTIDGLKQRRTK